MDKLIEHIQSSPLVRAAITESVHRFYYDRACSTYKQDRQDIADTRADEILYKLWNLNPNWRHTLLTVPQRYRGSDTKAVSIHGKPSFQGEFKIEISWIETDMKEKQTLFTMAQNGTKRLWRRVRQWITDFTIRPLPDLTGSLGNLVSLMFKRGSSGSIGKFSKEEDFHIRP